MDESEHQSEESRKDYLRPRMSVLELQYITNIFRDRLESNKNMLSYVERKKDCETSREKTFRAQLLRRIAIDKNLIRKYESFIKGKRFRTGYTEQLLIRLEVGKSIYRFK
jgi:hypothetical protein